MHSKTPELKRQVVLEDTLSAQLQVLHKQFAGETLFVLACGPSLREYTAEQYQSLLTGKVVVAVKQAIEVSPSSDFHCFNHCNYSPYHKIYEISEDTISMFCQPRPRKGWFPERRVKFDVGFPENIRGRPVITRPISFFDRYLMHRHPNRPRGEGIMHSTILFLGVHLGVSRIVTVGWDLGAPKGYKHFYAKLQRSGRMSRGYGPSYREHRRLLKVMWPTYVWLLTHGIELKICSTQSLIDERIPRTRLEEEV